MSLALVGHSPQNLAPITLMTSGQNYTITLEEVDRHVQYLEQGSAQN